MGDGVIAFWLVAYACVFLAVLFAVCNFGVFVLNWRAGQVAAYTPVARAVLGLTTVFVLPRILPYPLLFFGMLVSLLIWECAARLRLRAAGSTVSN